MMNIIWDSSLFYDIYKQVMDVDKNHFILVALLCILNTLYMVHNIQ